MDLPADIVRKPAGEKLVENHAEGIDIAARIEFEWIGKDLFGAHISQRPDNLSDVGLQRRLGVTVRDARYSEIENLRLSVLVHQNVARFEVAMDQAPLVRMVDRVTHLCQNLQPP